MARDRSTVRVGFLGDADQLAREAQRAQRSLDGVGTRAHVMGTAVGTALGNVAGRAMAGVAAAAGNAARGVLGYARDSVDAASDMNESLAKNAVVFGRNAETVRSWAFDSTKNILLTRQAAIEGAASFGNLFVAMGMGQAVAARMSTALVGLGTDLSSFNNVATEDALLALKSGLLGEAEPLRAFGVQLSAARVEAEAYALGLAKPVKEAAAITAANNAVAAATYGVTKAQKDHGAGTIQAAQARDKVVRAEAALTKAMAGSRVELTAAQKAQAAYSIIFKDTQSAQGDAARTQDGYANSTRRTRKMLSDISAEIGSKLMPYALRASKYVNGLLGEFQDGMAGTGRFADELARLRTVLRDVILPTAQRMVHALGIALKVVSEHTTTAYVALGLFLARGKLLLAWAIAAKAAMVGYGIALGVTAAASGSVIVASGGVTAALTAQTIAARANAIALGAAGLAMGTTALAAAGLGAAAAAATVQMYLLWKASKIGEGGGDARHKGLNPTPDYADPFDPKNMPGLTNAGAIRDPYRPATQADAASGRGDVSRPGYGMDPVAANVVRKAKAAAAAVTEAGGEEARAMKAYADEMAKAQREQEKLLAAQTRSDEAARKRDEALERAAERKRRVADALEAASQKLRDALQERVDTAKGIRDSLVGSNTVLQEGLSWSAKDLLSSFRKRMDSVKRFQQAISAMVHKGFAPSIIRQVAEAGVEGGMATAVGLSRATAAQVQQFNGVQAGIEKAAGITGDRAVRGIYPTPIVNVDVYLDGKKVGTAIAPRVNVANARAARNGSLLATA